MPTPKVKTSAPAAADANKSAAKAANVAEATVLSQASATIVDLGPSTRALIGRGVTIVYQYGHWRAQGSPVLVDDFAPWKAGQFYPASKLGIKVAASGNYLTLKES